MTLSKLIRQLQALEKAGWGRATVGVNKDTLNDGNGTYNICGITKCEGAAINMVDGDGFHRETKRGQEITRDYVVLKGDWFDDPTKEEGGRG